MPAYEETTIPAFACVFDFDPPSTLASHLGGGLIMSFLCQLAERSLRVLAQHDKTTAQMGTPVSQGAQLAWRHSFGYFSFAVERKVTRQWGETHNA